MFCKREFETHRGLLLHGHHCEEYRAERAFITSYHGGSGGRPEQGSRSGQPEDTAKEKVQISEQQRGEKRDFSTMSGENDLEGGTLSNCDDSAIDEDDDDTPDDDEDVDAKRVEYANSLEGDRFFKQYLTDPNALSFNDRNDDYSLLCLSADDLESNPRLLIGCLDLIEETSKADYNGSATKWSRRKKREEMLLPDMRYVLLGSDSESGLAGFISFMITYEDGHEVVYIYEIHLRAAERGSGWGTMLMDIAEQIGWEVGVEKAMLTVFKSNEKAVRWYLKSGYRRDKYSPGPRKFRDGTVKEAKYHILSKELKTEDEDVPYQGRDTIQREVKKVMGRKKAGRRTSGISFSKISVRDPTADDNGYT
jgi:N-alpha-acetyltransferase 40